ncbi:MAG: ATP-binding protein [Proteobacteria bacterium]|nr:ATP-binding protein [Pseudomonadota bacterium]
MNNVLIPKSIKNISKILDDGVILTDEEGLIILANSNAQEFLGKNLLNNNISKILKVKELKNFNKVFKNKSNKKEFYYQTNDQLKRSLIVKIKKINKTLFLILLLDMTLQRNLEKVRRDFVANVSHELRSPLTSLVGFIETLLSGNVNDEVTRSKFLKIMDEEAKRMNRLIDDILSLSRVETEEHISPSTSISILDPINSVIASIKERGLIKANKIIFEDLRSNINDQCFIIGNFYEVTQVFTNLLENAIKYGFDDTEIIIKLEQFDEKEIIINVINYGEGIPQKYIDRLTERFFRVDKARSRKIGGTGLGLAIVKHILIRHRAKMSIKSELNNQTIFSLNFPVSQR